MMVLAASVVVGLLAAGLYHLDAVRMMARLNRHPDVATGLLFVVALVARFTVAGLVVAALYLWSPLRIVAVGIAFMGAFIVLHARDLYLYAVGRGPLATVHQPSVGASPTKGKPKQDGLTQGRPRH
jgi:hypothetical protein